MWHLSLSETRASYPYLNIGSINRVVPHLQTFCLKRPVIVLDLFKSVPGAADRLQKGRHQGPKKDGKKRERSRKESYSTYVYKVLKEVHPDTGISSKAMGVMNSFLNIFEHIASEASRLEHYNKRWTIITSGEVQTALRLLLPGELATHAVSEGHHVCHQIHQLQMRRRCAQEHKGSFQSHPHGQGRVLNTVECHSKPFLSLRSSGSDYWERSRFSRVHALAHGCRK